MTASPKGFGLLFILVAPAGAGKNTLMNNVMERLDGLAQLATATTRPMREGEQQGREHLFVDDEAFQRMIDQGELLEYQQVHKKHYYGVPRAVVEQLIVQEQDRIADIDVLGATTIRKLYPDNVVLIFIQAPSKESLAERMRSRGEKEEEINVRLQRVEMETTYAPECDYLILNDDMNIAADTLQAIIIAQRSRREILKLRTQTQDTATHAAG